MTLDGRNVEYSSRVEIQDYHSKTIADKVVDGKLLRKSYLPQPY
jgi:hypothetical protein